MAQSKLNKELYNNITRLKLLNMHSNPKFILDKSPFDDSENGGGNAAATGSNDIIIVGRIFPDSEIYNQGAYQIEMKLPSTYPFDPPEIRFLTKIYHPNVSEKGEFCHELIKKTARWTATTSLVDVIAAVTKHIDQPNIDYSLSSTLGKEYMENRAEFNRKALEFVRNYACPRS